jgi:hypothetical protein
MKKYKEKDPSFERSDDKMEGEIIPKLFFEEILKIIFRIINPSSKF